jgi:two-component system chemotaxis response regulator CheB
MNRKVRVLVVDDSAFFRKRIVYALQESPDIEVVAEAADGRDAVDKARLHRPDVITMDVEMPNMDGITATKQILAHRPTQIIMFSALTQEGARATLDALDAGAVDFLPKASAHSGGDPGDRLRERVLALGRHPLSVPRVASSNTAAAARSTGRSARTHKPPRVVVIGASTGGPVALQQILTSLPAGFPLPVLVAVHMPAAFTHTFADRLDGLCKIRVREAANGDMLRPGEVLIAPGGHQMLLTGRHGNGRIQITDVPDQVYKPSVDLTFNAAAEVYGDGVLAVVLTGMGADGAKGAGVLKRYGAQLWSQNAETCVVYGMPAAVEKAGLSDQVLALDEIGPALAKVV